MIKRIDKVTPYIIAFFDKFYMIFKLNLLFWIYLFKGIIFFQGDIVIRTLIDLIIETRLRKTTDLFLLFKNKYTLYKNKPRGKYIKCINIFSSFLIICNFVAIICLGVKIYLPLLVVFSSFFFVSTLYLGMQQVIRQSVHDYFPINVFMAVYIAISNYKYFIWLLASSMLILFFSVINLVFFIFVSPCLLLTVILYFTDKMLGSTMHKYANNFKEI